MKSTFSINLPASWSCMCRVVSLSSELKMTGATVGNNQMCGPAIPHSANQVRESLPAAFLSARVRMTCRPRSHQSPVLPSQTKVVFFLPPGHFRCPSVVLASIIMEHGIVSQSSPNILWCSHYLGTYSSSQTTFHTKPKYFECIYLTLEVSAACTYDVSKIFIIHHKNTQVVILCRLGPSYYSHQSTRSA